MKFNKNHYIFPDKTRRNRKLTPPRLVLALIHLIAAPKLTGYLSALKKMWLDNDLDLDDLPCKSSLSEARDQFSYVFFQEAFETQVAKVNAWLPKLRGWQINAVDGDQAELPATDDVLAAGYRGYPCKGNLETHYPRMYYTSKVEVFSGVVLDVRQSENNDECKNAVQMALEAGHCSITLYDRLHFSLALARAHEASGSRYIARLKVGDRVLLDIQKFVESKRRAKRICIDGLHIRFLRVKNPKTGAWMYLATNLKRGVFKIREIQWLYWRRYDIETVFRDLTATHSLGVWHSTKLNGLLQEFYLHFSVHNASRFLILSQGGIEIIKDQKTGEYKRPNLKLIREHLVANFKLLIQQKGEDLLRGVKILIKKSMELRTYFSRLTPRQTKYSRNMYQSASLVVRRA